MTKEWRRFETIENDKNGYFISYSPVFTGQPFATLNLTFYENISAKKAIKIIEAEFDYWVEKYPTPLITFITDETEKKISYQAITGNDYLIGYPANTGVIKKVWGHMDEAEFSNFDLSKETLESIYAPLSRKTSQDADLDIRKKIAGIKIFRYASILWFCIIPGLIAWLGLANPTVSLIALIFSIYLAIKEYLKITNRLPKTERQKAKNKESLQKEHHHYHCSLNPKGFERLKVENIKKKHKEKIKEKVETLRS